MRRNRPALFKGRHFEAEIIVLFVRWYLRFALSFRNLEEMMAERNLHVDHVTIWRWVQRYAPELNRRCRRELRTTNGVVESRRDVLAGGRQVDLFISRGGFGGCHD
jgi:transposase, IS6 family